MATGPIAQKARLSPFGKEQSTSCWIVPSVLDGEFYVDTQPEFSSQDLHKF